MLLVRHQDTQHSVSMLFIGMALQIELKQSSLTRIKVPGLPTFGRFVTNFRALLVHIPNVEIRNCRGGILES